MEWLFAVIFLVGFHFGQPSSLLLKEDNTSLEEPKLPCDILCSKRGDNEFIIDDFKLNTCQCSMNSNVTGLQEQNDEMHMSEDNTKHSAHIIAKRNTLEDLTKKINKNYKKSQTLKLLTTVKPKMKVFQKKLPHNFNMRKSAIHLPQHLPKHPTLHQEFQERLRELKARMSATPLLGARGAFSKEELPNLIEQFKKTQEEFKEKMKASSKIDFPIKTDFPNRLPNRFDISATKVGSIHKTNKFEKQNKKEADENNNERSAANMESSSTEPSKVSHIPVVVLMPSTTPQPSPVVRSSNTENMNAENKDNKKIEVFSSAIERIKEKQKEAVTKIKDKISSTKIKSKENEEVAKTRK